MRFARVEVEWTAHARIRTEQRGGPATDEAQDLDLARGEHVGASRDGLHGIRGRSSMLYFVAFAGTGERPTKATVVSAIPWAEVSEDVVQVTSASIPHCHRWVRVLWPPSRTAQVALEACLPAFRPEKP